MARKYLTEEIARERGMTELQLLQNLTAEYANQEGMADAIGVSQPAISDALRRNKFVLRSTWVREDQPSERCEVVA